MRSISIGTKFGNWTIINVMGRAATCACRCGNVRIISADAIAADEAVPSCGCVPLTPRERYEAKRKLRRRQCAVYATGGRAIDSTTPADAAARDAGEKGAVRVILK